MKIRIFQKSYFIIGAILFFTVTRAQTISVGVGYEQYHMPRNIPALGVVTLHGIMHFYPYFYSGLVGYEAVSGNRGGYFGLAVDAGLTHPIYHAWWADAGLRVGGAGGQNSPVGGGLFLEPYAGVQYHFNPFRIGLEYSYITFPSGDITSHQIGVELFFPTTFACEKNEGKNYVAVLGRTSMPASNTRDTAGKSDTARFESLGIEAAHFLERKFFIFGNFVGAIHGRLNGYAQSILGLGYAFPLTVSHQLNFIVRAGAGSAGGGAVNTGGGLIVEPAVGFEYRVTKPFAIELNGGYVDALHGSFHATEINFLLKYYVNARVISELENHWRIRVFNQTYLKPRAADGNINPTMQLLSVGLDYFMRHYFYITGQTAFAYVGKQTGGYFSGMLGVGVQKGWFFSEILAGTAGGAGLDIHSGALFEPVIGVNYFLNKTLGLQISAGQLIAFQGRFNSTVINAGLNYLLP